MKNMLNFGDKSMLTSKTFWTAVVTFAVGGAKAIGYDIPEYFINMLMGVGLYSLRDAVGKK
tara:strand:+ start:692 stop:874 length:183 start_codon:yes stop_codon:yes gene_type:complete